MKVYSDREVFYIARTLNSRKGKLIAFTAARDTAVIMLRQLVRERRKMTKVLARK